MIQRNSLWSHIFSLIALPFTVLVVIPYYIYNFISPKCCLFFDFIPGILLQLISIPILILGVFLFIRTIQLFAHRGKGTLAPWDPPKKLVLHGPYQHVRNPMISAVNMMLLSIAFLTQNENLLLWQIIFFIMNTVYFILKEEVDLQSRFGKDYIDYKSNVNRWIPRIKPWSPND